METNKWFANRSTGLFIEIPLKKIYILSILDALQSTIKRIHTHPEKNSEQNGDNFQNTSIKKYVEWITKRVFTQSQCLGTFFHFKWRWAKSV